jgi:hypothetical protein
MPVWFAHPPPCVILTRSASHPPAPADSELALCVQGKARGRQLEPRAAAVAAVSRTPVSMRRSPSVDPHRETHSERPPVRPLAGWRGWRGLSRGAVALIEPSWLRRRTGRGRMRTSVRCAQTKRRRR